jgi:hypothetical protein
MTATSASAATNNMAKVTFAGSVVKGADGSITASGTFSSKVAACVKAVPFAPRSPSYPYSPRVTFSGYPGPGAGMRIFLLLQVGPGRWQLVIPPGTTEPVITIGSPTPPEPRPVSAATRASLGFDLKPVKGSVVTWHVKKGGSRITCTMREDQTGETDFSI